MCLTVDNVQINSALLTRVLNDAGPLGRSTAAFLKAELRYLRRMPTTATESRDKGFLKSVKDSHLMSRLSTIRAPSLELEWPDDAMLTAQGPAIKHLLNIVKLRDVSHNVAIVRYCFCRVRGVICTDCMFLAFA